MLTLVMRKPNSPIEFHKPVNLLYAFGIVLAIWMGLFVLLMVGVQVMAWWTGKSPGFYWP